MINKRQYIILSFFLTRSLFLGGGISLLVNISQNNLLLSSFLGMLLGYFILYLFYTKNSICRFTSIIISIAVLFINLLANTVLASTYLIYNTPIILIMLFVILVFIYGSSKDFCIIGRISELLIIVSIIVFALGYLSLFTYIDTNNLFPLFDTNLLDFIKGICVFCGASLVPNILLLNYKENLKFKDISIGYIAGSISVLIIMFFILSIYGSEFASITRFPEYSVLKKISFLNYISNVENILIMEWIVNIIISGLVCSKVLRDNINKFWFYMICMGLIITMMFISSNYINILFIKQFGYYIFFGLIFVSLLLPSKNKSTN